MGANKWLKITGWKQTGELERVSSFDKICSLSTYYTQKCYLTVFIYKILLNNSQKVSVVMTVFIYEILLNHSQKVSVVMIVLLLPPWAHLQQFYTHLCVCACVCERERACEYVVYTEPQQKSLSQSGNCRKMSIWEDQVLDASSKRCPLMFQHAMCPFFMLITCVCVCACLLNHSQKVSVVMIVLLLPPWGHLQQ